MKKFFGAITFVVISAVVFSIIVSAVNCDAADMAILDSSVGTEAGDLRVFEVENPASWLVIPENESWKVDSDAKKLYFASPRRGTFTVIASVKDEGEASGIKILSLTFENGEEDGDDDDVFPDDFTEYVKASASKVTGATESERKALSGAFEVVSDMISDGVIKTPQTARMTLKNRWTSAVSKDAVVRWNTFFTLMDAKLDDDLEVLKEQMKKVSEGLK